MAGESSQRSYRAPCPGCGAPVEFRSAQSTHAVCAYCHSTVVRSGEVLQRVGKMAELFDDHSPLQLMASGRILFQERNQAFTLIGRLQYQGDSGPWAEWIAIFEDGTTASLSEDNGAYVFSRPREPGREVPAADHLRVGMTTSFGGKSYSVASNVTARLVSAEGELPKLPPLGQPFTVVELRSEDGEVLSIDYGANPPRLESGRSVALEELALTGLKDTSTKEETGRQFNCPNCGAPVEVKLSSTKSLTCRACNSLIDLTQGVGGELFHAEQDEPVQLLIPLGSKGTLEGVAWQVVGFQHRMGAEPGDDELFGWEEYLLYNLQRGFAFLVDSEDGWSLVRPATGAPKLEAGERVARYLGKSYSLQYQYNAETTYVAGEFYWPVVRGQKTYNRDFGNGNALLSMEQSPREITWSVGNKINSDKVVEAFKLQGKAEAARRRDAAPLNIDLGGGVRKGIGCGTIILILVILLIVLVLMNSCSGSSGSTYYRSSGGSSGGYSSGGGHK